MSRCVQFVVCAVLLAGSMQHVARAEDCPLDVYRPACGKICKLVCEKKKLVAIGYGNECKTICVPGPSQPGCKHCAVCCGEHKCDPCSCCQTSAPKCEFCWRDWFACGCARPRTVKVLTKWQAEKKVCWYHWEVVDAATCGCGSASDETDRAMGIAQATSRHEFYKAAPEGAALGEVLPISNEDWVKLAAVLDSEEPDPNEQVAADDGEARANAELSVAERLEKFFSK